MGQNGKYQTDRYVRMAHHFTNTGETAPSFFLREANKGTKGKKESMFLVSDGNRANRRKLIEQVAGEDRVIKVLLAAIDFEWTLRRTVMALGYSPTKQLAEKMSKREFRHFDGIKKLWKDEVVGHLGKGAPTLAQVIDTTAKMPTDARGNASACLQKARECRNNIVHGNQGQLQQGIRRIAGGGILRGIGCARRICNETQERHFQDNPPDEASGQKAVTINEERKPL